MIDVSSPTFWPQLIAVLLEGTWETIYMTAIAMAITFVVGLPLGIILVGTEQGRFLEAPFGSRALGRVINALLGFIVNLGRSVPFIVLMIALIPLTRWLLGSFIGTGPAIVPLTLIAIPFFVRVVEIAVREVDPGLFEAAESLLDIDVPLPTGGTDLQPGWLPHRGATYRAAGFASISRYRKGLGATFAFCARRDFSTFFRFLRHLHVSR